MIEGRVHAERDEPFVVFLIGMRVNRLWAVHRWLPIFLVAPRMVRELRGREDSGLLGSRNWVGWRSVGFVQYWESVEDLRAYARDADAKHLDAWQSYDAETAASGAVGIWHETYRVDPDDYETVYNRMPAHGLGAAEGAALEDAAGSDESMFGRLGRTDGSDAAVTADGDRVERRTNGERGRNEASR